MSRDSDLFYDIDSQIEQCAELHNASQSLGRTARRLRRRTLHRLREHRKLYGEALVRNREMAAVLQGISVDARWLLQLTSNPFNFDREKVHSLALSLLKRTLDASHYPYELPEPENEEETKEEKPKTVYGRENETEADREASQAQRGLAAYGKSERET